MIMTNESAGHDGTPSAPTTTPDPDRTGQSPSAADPTRLTTCLRVILAVVLIADVLDLMDSTITNIAAPTIVRDIGGGESLIKWLGASYALAMGVLLVVGGRLGDRYGKRRMFLVGMAGFTLASVWCGLSVDPAMLIAGRLVQGGFGALLIPQGIGILIGSFSRAQIPRAVSAFGPVMGACAVLGPIVAGFIISADIAGLTWRPIFLINIALGAAGFIAALRLLPHDTPASAVPIDGLGSGLLGASMFALIYGLIEGSTAGGAALPFLSLAAGGVLLAGFGVRQRMATDPLILPSLLKNKGFTAGLLLGLAFFAAVNGLAYVLSLFYQTALGLTPRAAAIALSPLVIGINFTTGPSRRRARNDRQRRRRRSDRAAMSGPGLAAPQNSPTRTSGRALIRRDPLRPRSLISPPGQRGPGRGARRRGCRPHLRAAAGWSPCLS